MLGKTEGRREKGATEDEMVGWNHRPDGHECEQTLGDSEGQGGLACCSSWGCKESDMTEKLKKNNNIVHGKPSGRWCLYKPCSLACTHTHTQRLCTRHT